MPLRFCGVLLYDIAVTIDNWHIMVIPITYMSMWEHACKSFSTEPNDDSNNKNNNVYCYFGETVTEYAKVLAVHLWILNMIYCVEKFFL